MRLRLGPSSIAIERGDITDWEVDAIVNAATSTLAMGTGVAGAIKRKGGVIIEEEAMRQGPVEVGEAVLTTGGNLAATHVIHAAVMGPDLKTDGDLIAATTRAVLALAAKHRITSLALPALGTLAVLGAAFAMRSLGLPVRLAILAVVLVPFVIWAVGPGLAAERRALKAALDPRY